MVGLGRFGGGLGAARWLLAQGAAVTVTDRAARDTLAEPAAELASLGAALVLGGHEGIDPADHDLVVLNPAVPLQAPLVQAARAAHVPVTSEIALLVERWPGPVLGVTGSNGKSTTVALCRQLLERAGVPALAGGNLGGSLLPRLAEADDRTVAVLELSSFMLELLGPAGLGPDVAIVTNLTPNHLDRHGTFAAYRDAKAAILGRARRAVLNASDPEVASLAGRAPRRVVRFGDARDRPDVGVDREGSLVDAQGVVIIAAADVPLPGRMNAFNLAAALLAVEEFTPTVRRQLASALDDWQPLDHRLQTVTLRDGVHWIDDSVSTTPESTAASLSAVEGPCLLIAGGHDKGLDPRPLVEAARRAARRVLTIGEQGPALARMLARAGIRAEVVHTVPAAVARAACLARAGDAVLLSPGYSSHDQYLHFEARAQAFRVAVQDLDTGPEDLSHQR